MNPRTASCDLAAIVRSCVQFDVMNYGTVRLVNAVSAAIRNKVSMRQSEVGLRRLVGRRPPLAVRVGKDGAHVAARGVDKVADAVRAV